MLKGIIMREMDETIGERMLRRAPICRDGKGRARGCLLGQLSGDSLGSLVEFMSPDQILRRYPRGVRELADGDVWHTIAGQPTDDSEMALLLARMLVREGRYDPSSALAEYRFWLDTAPFDCGMTIASALQGRVNPESQANGAMMRISPLGIFAAKYSLELADRWAREDARLTHPNPVCLDANALFTRAIAFAVKEGPAPEELYGQLLGWARKMGLAPSLMEVIERAADEPPEDFLTHQGWVLIAFGNALYQLLHAVSFEEGVVDTVMRGGDTDTNAAICGALLGALYGGDAVPDQWKGALASCHPREGDPRVLRPRPECFWPTDAVELADTLVDWG
jgi:ADP-ribosyl-[dinitrogen reductase] hydrolase